ncbi:MAG: hypothetical protein ACJ76Z_14640 [Thermoleophilaceae bacterium]
MTNNRVPFPALSSMKVLIATLAVGFLALVPAAIAAPPGGHAGHQQAHAAGSDVVTVLPSIVRVRIERGTKALEHAGDYVDRDLPDRAVASLLNARRNMYAAWRGAQYVVLHAPPPPAAAGSFHRKAKASRVKANAADYADAPTTAVAALGFQHTVANAAYGLLDGAKGALRDAVSTTIFAALDRRDQAIEWIHAHQPPPPAAAGRFHRRARASGAPVGGDFSTMMPGVVPDLDDEMQQIEGLLDGGALTPGEKRIMGLADFQVFRTERTVNAYWPPVVAG